MTDLRSRQLKALQRAAKELTSSGHPLLLPGTETDITIDGEIDPQRVVFHMRTVRDGSRMYQRAHCPWSMIELMPDGDLPGFIASLLADAFQQEEP